jgi:hypothetical protein
MNAHQALTKRARDVAEREHSTMKQVKIMNLDAGGWSVRLGFGGRRFAAGGGQVCFCNQQRTGCQQCRAGRGVGSRCLSHAGHVALCLLTTVHLLPHVNPLCSPTACRPTSQ